MSTMIDQKYNLQNDEALEHILSSLAANATFYDSVRIRCAAVPKDGKWVNGICRITAFPQGNIPPREISRRYRQLHLLEEWISVESLPGFIGKTVENAVIVDTEAVEFGPDLKFRQWRHMEAHNEFSPLTGYLYTGEGSSSSSINIPFEPLRMPKLPPYSDMNQAIQEWMDIRDLNLMSSSFRGGVLIFLPERRAYFKNVEFSSGEARISVFVGENLKSKITLSGLWLKNTKKIGQFTDDSLSTEIILPVPVGSDGCQIYLVDEMGEPLDQRTVYSLDAPRNYLGDVGASGLITPFAPPEPEAAEINPELKKVFIVHGHDSGLREAVARLIESLDLEPIVLHEQLNQGRTLPEKLEAHSKVGFSVVILTPDDFGESKANIESLDPEVTEKDFLQIYPKVLKQRARQNVILELGYFWALLGRARVCALYTDGVEIPSDFKGIVFVQVDGAGSWRYLVAREMKAAGLDVNLNNIK
jgi:predicted nucleotide-binding protein